MHPKPFYETLCEEIVSKASSIRDDEDRAATIEMTLQRMQKQEMLEMLSAKSEEERRKYIARATYKNRRQVLRNRRRHDHYMVYIGNARTLDFLAPSTPDRSGSLEAEDALETALVTLTELERKVLALRHVEGLKLKEIAGLLRTSIANVSQTLGRAKDKIEKYREL